MFRNSLSWYIFTLSLLELIIKTHLTLHDSSHGFISKNPSYFDDDLSSIHEEISLRSSRKSDVSLKEQLKFEPSFLDFKLRPLGVPHLEKVTLFNLNENRSIDMTSISGSTVHFHSSFFEDKRIPPNGNTSFNVVFLGREEGFVESSLFIHTSEGFLKYNVKGCSTFSHYRLRPLVGIKLPLNSSFSPLIYMHNPHSEPIQIVEIYSSGGDFHLELPSGEQEGPNDMWEIPPQHTKPVIRVRFFAKVVQNHTAYVRIKLNRPDEMLVVPLEVEVTSVLGLFHPQGFVDFGIGGQMDGPKEVKLCLYNPLSKHVRIHSVFSTSEAVKAQYYNVRLPPEEHNSNDANRCVEVGSLTVDWKAAYELKDFSGKILVKYRSGKNVSEIPYHITVLKGGLKYDPLITTYFINDLSVDMSLRTFKVKNEFDYPLKVTNISYSQDVNIFFKIENLCPKVIQPGQESTLFTIKLKNQIRLSELQLESQIVLKTNISDVVVPLLSYNGQLQINIPFKSKDYSLDIGLIGFETRKEVFFSMVNLNPVTINLKIMPSTIPMTKFEIEGCGDGDHRLVLFQVAFANLTKCSAIKPNHYAIIKVMVDTQKMEGQVWGEINIETQFQKITFPMHFKVASGKLEIGPDRLVFDQCFPAKICSHPLRVHSTFNDPMIIDDIITLPPDRRISSHHTGHILARTSKVIGHLFLNPDVECQGDCYTGLQTDTSAQWLTTFVLTEYVADFDSHLLNVFYHRYLNLTSNGMRKWQNLTLRLDTTEVRGHVFKTRVKMSWPSLLADQSAENRSLVIFPLTQVGNYTYRNVTIKNPASYNIVVQIVMDTSYPNVELLYDRLPNDFKARNRQDFSGNHGFFISNDTIEMQAEFFYDTLGIAVKKDTVPVHLYPGESFSLNIGFYARDTDLHTALLLLRNNLTILEVIKLRAQGSAPQFKFGNRKPGSAQPLLFDMTDKHLRDCESKKYMGIPMSLTVKRTFTARNIGDVAVYVSTFHVNDFPCEGYGFKVVDCEPFELLPNGTKKIDIAFTPDLTLSKVTRTLVLGTSLNVPVNYTLYTTIPNSYLTLCSDLIARPRWESQLRYLAMTLMFILFFIVITLALIDSERIRRQTATMNSFSCPNGPPVQPVLDLRLVGQQTREEIQSTKNEPPINQAKVQEKDKEEKVNDREEKAGSKDSVNSVPEETKPKETERYSVLVPTTGKAKKKLGKRNGGESNVEIDPSQSSERTEKKKEKPEKKRDKKTDSCCCKTEEKEKAPIGKEKDSKKSYNGKKITKSIVNVPSNTYEEESSSTTTDSCSNNDEETEKNQKDCPKDKNKIVSKPTPVAKVIEENINHSTESHAVKHQVSFVPGHHVHKAKHQKPLKSGKIGEKSKEYEMHHHKTEYHNKSLKKRDKAAKERKEKMSYHKKLNKHNNSERQNEAEKNKSPSSFFVLMPAPKATSSVWAERAKFSDVVARSETKPERSVKSQNPVELGPIGSRRTERTTACPKQNRKSLTEDFDLHEDGFRSGNRNGLSRCNELEEGYAASGFLQDPSAGMFLKPSEIHSESNGSGSVDGFFQDFAAISNWNNQQNQPLSGLLENDLSDNRLGSIEIDNVNDVWSRNLLGTNSYWNNTYTPLLEPNPINTDNLLSERGLTETANYLWGSSPVWKPWAPETHPGTPTRTPPGFDELLRRNDQEEQPQSREDYNPFNSTNIWTQQENNPWNYSQGQ